MSFIPKISVTAVPRDSSSFTFIDTTGTYPADSTGYGSPNAPANQGVITTYWAGIIPYSENQLPGQAPTGDAVNGLTSVVACPDGVNTMEAFYGYVQTLTDGTVAADRMSFTTMDPDMATKFAGVTYVQLDNSFPCPILSTTSAMGVTTILLGAPLSTTVASFTTITTYWTGSQRVLVFNCSQCKINNQIALLPLSGKRAQDAPAILDIMLQQAAGIVAMQCKNYSKAHQAIRLVCTGQPVIPTNCPACR
jgi:hypothetical protein